MSVDQDSNEKFIYSVVVMTFTDSVRASASCNVAMTTLQEMVAYQHACKLLINDLKKTHGEPVRIEKDDDLDDPAVLLNQQLVIACDLLSNSERYIDGPNKGKMKLSWIDRYRRIDAIYDKLRKEPQYQEMVGQYYQVEKTKLTIIKK
jgi:hypothetical protein